MPSLTFAGALVLLRRKAGFGGLGPCIRRIEGAPGERTLYLTFDDGPDERGTAATLEVLERFGVKATFFVIAKQAERNPQVLRQISSHGHSVGNHSLDHSWMPFFSGRRALLAWVKDAESLLSDLLGHPTVGFRSPAGVQTPPLHWALRQLEMRLIHWNVRFYDAVWAWQEQAATKSLTTTKPGSIILLHDRQRSQHQQRFLATLEVYLRAANAAGFTFKPLFSAQAKDAQSA